MNIVLRSANFKDETPTAGGRPFDDGDRRAASVVALAAGDLAEDDIAARLRADAA